MDKKLNEDNVRLSIRCDILQQANMALRDENAHLRLEIEALNKRLYQKLHSLKICKDCGTEFVGGDAARYCETCRKRRMRENARKVGLSRIGQKARWRNNDENY